MGGVRSGTAPLQREGSSMIRCPTRKDGHMAGRVEVVAVWDWYDGLVTGLVQLPSATGIFLASAVAWSWTTRTRAFCCVPLSETQAAEVRALVQGPWEQNIERVKAYCQRLGGTASVVVVDERLDQIQAESTVALGSAVADMMGDIEAAMAPAREHWLSAPR
jgi:hypothetical protein